MARLFRARKRVDLARRFVQAPPAPDALLLTPERLQRLLGNDDGGDGPALWERLLLRDRRTDGRLPPPDADVVSLPYHPRVLFKLAGGAGRGEDAAAFEGLPPDPEVRDLLRVATEGLGSVNVQRAIPLDPRRVRAVFPEGLSWYAIEVSSGVSPHEIAARMRQKAGEVLASVRGHAGRAAPLVYVEPRAALPPGDGAEAVDQVFLGAHPPESLGFATAQRWAGTTGAGVRYFDIEQGWTLCHHDLPRTPDGQPAIPLIGGLNYGFAHHGTAVLGIIGALRNNGLFGTGMAPDAQGHAVSTWYVKPGWVYPTAVGWGGAQTRAAAALADESGVDGPLVRSEAAALILAMERAEPGDVIVIESQSVRTLDTVDGVRDVLVPVEVDRLVYDLIREAAYVRGLVVVEAGANGDLDLDTFFDRDEGFVLSRQIPDREDSGAILVGAARAGQIDGAGNLLRATWSSGLGSNHGGRIDLCAWGDLVATIGGVESAPADRDAWTRAFGGTSAATAIVAGAAVMLQGAVKHASVAAPLASRDMRQALAHQGVPSLDIGRMPKLPAVLRRAVGPLSTADLRLERFPGDAGVEPSPNLPTDSPAIDIGAPPPWSANSTVPVDVAVQNASGDPVSDAQVRLYWGRVTVAGLAGAEVLPDGLDPTAVAQVAATLDPGQQGAAHFPAVPTPPHPGLYVLLAVTWSQADPEPLPPDSSAGAALPMGDVIEWLISQNSAAFVRVELG